MDDHRLIRQGIAGLVATESDMRDHRRTNVSDTCNSMPMATPKPQSGAVSAFVALGMLLWAGAAVALTPSLDITQYAHNAWTIQDNFLKGAVRSIVQTSDGYLWLGTEFGLVRFDGVRFVAWAPTHDQRLPSSNIRSLLAARDGTLWIGTLEGLAGWKDGKLHQYAELAGLNVLSLLEDRDGVVWAGTFGVPNAKLCAIQRGDVKCFGDDSRFGQWVWSLHEDGDGHLWVGAETGLWRWKPGRPKRYAMQHPIDTAQALADGDSPGELLAVSYESVWHLAHEKLEGYPLAMPPGRLTPVNVLRDGHGGLWVGTLQRGLMHVYQGKTRLFAQTDGLSSDRVLSMFEDREGDVWVGTMDGLDRFRETAVYSLSVKQGLSSPSVWAVLVAHDNSVWLSTLDGLNRWKEGHITIYRPPGDAKESARMRDQQPGAAVYDSKAEPAVTEITDPGVPDKLGSLYEDDRGRIWVSSPDGIVRFEGGRFSRVKELPGGWVNAITGDADAGLWISYQDQGLVHWVDGKVVERVPWSRLGGNVTASAVIPDPTRGGLWLGFFQGGLLHFKDGQVRASYGKKEGLGGGRVMGLQLDADGTLWAATEGGLSRLRDGGIVTLTSTNGLPCNTVHWALELDASFWLYTACGLLRTSRTELENWASDPRRKIELTVFDNSDGVRSHALLTGYTPRVSQSADGKLWFAHFPIASVIDPDHLALNKIPPPVHIEQVVADAETYDAATALRLPPLVRNLAIDYTALSLVVPEKVHFKYKLEGQDPNWREVINGREARYSNLSPGTYRFRVIASNNSGVWNEQGAFLDFSIAPAFWQTLWFRAACALALAGLLWMLYLLRLRQVAREFERSLDTRVAERTRIARDLHDTLLQSFNGLLLRFATAARLLRSQPEAAEEMLNNTIDQARQAIKGGRQAVQGLRSSTEEPNDLAEAISRLAEELSASAPSPEPSAGSVPPPIGIQVRVEGASRRLHPLVRDEIYRIAAEALRNALQHSHGTQLEVELHYDVRQFRLQVRDDGQGIDAGLLASGGREGHFGLKGMRERAEITGGKLAVWSAPGSGTEVELTIPASRAYAAARSPH